MAMLQERMAGLDQHIRMEATSSTSGANAANIFAQQQQQASGGMGGSLDQERQARIATEQEAGKLTVTNISTVSSNGRHEHGQPIINTLLILIYIPQTIMAILAMGGTTNGRESRLLCLHLF